MSSREQCGDIETEAIALSALGLIYTEVLRLEAIGTALYRRALRLAHTLWPKYLHSEKWFQKCLEVRWRPCIIVLAA